MIDDDEAPATSKPASTPVFVWAGVMVALTLGATAAGTGLGLLLGGTPDNDIAGGAKPLGAVSETNYGGETSLRELPPIIANLAEPSNARVRVQASIVFDSKAVPKPAVIAAEVGEDILGFMRTLSEAQLGGASGLQHLREDLNERASIRSGGLVRELIIQTLVV